MRKIAQANNLSDFEIRRIIYGMLQAGLVELIKPKKPQPTVESGKASARAARQQATTESPAARRSVVERLIHRIRGL
jgi:hypothetical protein